MKTITDLTLGQLLDCKDATIARNAMSILKSCQKLEYCPEHMEGHAPGCIGCITRKGYLEAKATEDPEDIPF